MFDVYVLFLILSGVTMLVMAFVRTDYAKRRQALNFVLGAGFTIYGLYLLLFFNGGHYIFFYYVFVLPVFMVVQFFRDRGRAKLRQMATNPAAGGAAGGSDPGPGTWAAGPQAAGPQAAGPWESGPQAAGPWATGGQAPGYQPNRDRW
jgi:hypothetical protein